MPPFPGSPARSAEVGLATDVYLLRVNFVGALGWELHFPIEYAHHLFDALFDAGAEFGIGMAGMRAMESLRMEKSYRMWGTDLTPDYTPFEAGLDRFVRMNKGAFIGKEALQRQLADGVPHRFVTFEVHGVGTRIRSAMSRCSTPEGRLVGRATSGYYGHALRKSLAIGYVKPQYAAVGGELADRDPGRAQARHRARRFALRPGEQGPPGLMDGDAHGAGSFSALALLRRGLSRPPWLAPAMAQGPAETGL